MKRFIVFSGLQYYPEGGMSDFDDSFDTLDEAKNFLLEHRYDWAHVYDTVTQERVYDSKKR